MAVTKVHIDSVATWRRLTAAYLHNRLIANTCETFQVDDLTRDMLETHHVLSGRERAKLVSGPGVGVSLAVVADFDQVGDDCLEVLCENAPTQVGGNQQVTVPHISTGALHVIVVSGAHNADGTALSDACIGRLHSAASHVKNRTDKPALIIMSGWAGLGKHNVELAHTEAQQMRTWWYNNVGEDHPVFVDTAARTTAENMVNAAELVKALPSDTHIFTPASWPNAPRQMFAAKLAFRGMAHKRHTPWVWGSDHTETVGPGIRGLWLVPTHVKAGRAHIRCGPDTGAALLPSQKGAGK